MDFDKIKDSVLSSSETSTSESESISGSELHEEFEINNFLPEFEPIKLSGKNLAQQYVSAFNTGMNIYQCLNYLQGYVYTLVTAMNETIEAWNTVVPLLEQATKEWTDEEFDYKWSILKPQVIELVTNLTIETFNKSWEELKPQVIKLAQDTTDAEFKKQWDILKPQVIELVQNTTTEKFNDEWENLRPTIIQLSTDTTIEQFNKSWAELKPKVIELSQQTTSDKFDEKWEELRPQVIELAQTTTSNKFDEKWEALQPTLTETVNNLAKTQTTTTFNEKWEELKPTVIELAQTTTNTKFDEKWTELQPTLTETVNNLVNTNLETFKSTLWQEVTKNESFPFLLPENFGAVGDGVTDDSNAFTECFATANANHKYILLSTKTYLITKPLTNISGTNLIGYNTTIKLGNNMFTKQVEDCLVYNIKFIREIDSMEKLMGHFYASCFKSCYFKNIWFLFNDVKPKENNFTHVLFEDSYLLNTGISYNLNDINEVNYIINNTNIILDDNAKLGSFILYGSIGNKIIFNNCTIIKNNTDNFNAMFATKDNLLFNSCEIQNKYTTFRTTTSSNKFEKISFNNCIIKNTNNNSGFILIEEITKQMITIQFINTQLDASIIATSNNEFNLWLENCVMETKPIINNLSGKVNFVEIQQKYSDTSENIFPWDKETPTPTVENNVTINSAGTGNYYVLTENEDKTIKKLDYYFKYTQLYTKGAPYYNTGQTFNGLDLTGYTVKTFMLKNNIFKLKDSNGDLIDYVYFDLNSADILGGAAGAIHYTTVNMQFIPAVTKWTGKEETNGNVEVNTCITLILEKTSS
nr:MAG TPA: tailspike protein [Caudoviricetes sp.]